ncbi:MAG: hypothetical protein KGR26_16770 [Cyanobacteria bacterium REEB65]|nr:hypothetical protein [Cyanobacteria bacterium REEB65]
MTGVRVEISKTVSDGSYGNERFNAQYIAELDEGDDPDEVIRALSARGRANVVGQLAESESASIRYAISPPKDVYLTDVCPECGDHHNNGEGNLCGSCADAHDGEDVEPDDVPF